jgi:alkaline phosphatase isozyme conversion protein
MKKALTLLLFVSLLGTACNLNTGLEPQPAGIASGNLVPLNTPQINYGEQARSYITTLTDFGQRAGGTQAEAQASQFIMEAFIQMGYETELQPFSVEAASGEIIESFNVIATRFGRSGREIIVGAHTDSTGTGPGADDNASGMAVLLETASLLRNDSTPYTIRFVAFGAGENGNLGSNAYRDHMSQTDFENALVMIDLDSLIAGDTAYLSSSEGIASELRDWTLEWAFGNSLELQTRQDFDFSGATGIREVSDYAPFWAVGIPVVFMETTNWDLGARDGVTQADPQFGENGVIRHTAFDSLDYLDQTFPGRVDARLKLFVPLLYHILSQYEVPDQ